ncbi:hypothetical protein DW089_11000 [Acidaminococcus sp. AM05-11]|nr:hypothetical protein DW089_11000 [Acidaminococcus sp. AM05-11]
MKSLLGENMENYKKINGGFQIILSKKLFERETIFSIAYKYNKKFFITFNPIGEDEISFVVKNKGEGMEPLPRDLENIMADFIDEQLRIDILRRTQSIRNQIYEKAFFPLRTINK